MLAIAMLLPCAAVADEWSRGDIDREVVYMVAHAIDWRQTRKMSDDGWTGAYGYERNMLLSKTPSSNRVDNYFAATAIAHVIVASALPSEWRKNFQIFTIGMETGVALHNYYSVGVRIGF